MEHGFYHPTIGYWQANSDVSEEILSSYPEGTKEIPIMPGEGYTYNGEKWLPPTQEWIINSETEKALQLRKVKLIREVDPVVTNPLRWQDMSLEKQNEWIKYRRDLLDITLQKDFPLNISWPIKPE